METKKTQTRTQTCVVTMAAAQADGTLQENTIQFDRAYDRCTGIATIERTASGVFYQTGVKSPRGSEIDPAGAAMLHTSAAVEQDAKFRTVNWPVVDGELMTAQVTNKSGAVTPAGGIVVEFIFRLERDLA